MAKKTEAAPVKTDPALEEKLSQLVGNIVEPPKTIDVPPAFHQPAPAELAAFPPPPPLTAPSSVFPQAPPGMVFGDRSTHNGLTVGHMSPNPVVDTPVAPEPPPPPKFEDLPIKTRNEMMAAHVARGGTATNFHYEARNTFHVPRSNVEPSSADVQVEPTVDLSKLSAKTRAEYEAGQVRLARRKSDYKQVLDHVAKMAADKLAEGGPAHSDNMSYPAA